MKKFFKSIGVAMVLIAAAFIQPQANAQPAIAAGYYSPVTLAGGGTWTNRIAGGTSATNYQFIDISAYQSSVTVELQQQSVATSPNGGLMLWVGKSNGPIGDYNGAGAGAPTNNVDLFSIVTNAAVSATALVTTVGHSNYTLASTGNQCPIGYRYLVIGPISNACSTAASYATNYKVLVYGR